MVDVPNDCESILVARSNNEEEKLELSINDALPEALKHDVGEKFCLFIEESDFCYSRQVCSQQFNFKNSLNQAVSLDNGHQDNNL